MATGFKPLLLLTLFFLFISHPVLSMAQEISEEGWPIPDLEGLLPYSIALKSSDGVEKMDAGQYTADERLPGFRDRRSDGSLRSCR